ncbi:WXG100 family type VII secretion target [Aldersonia sp. NBC_00410]|uniref:WXG100 family type VII secretion target n=1 Tax=Aldersonia sp. NBC_00410 TaxID=2975954 RepID=UPI0022568E35|nr:WXG100 family type VII secretion target [Aldersonia sp. NBC_00410]MCX5043931.1 WXG100 family type VII secretion target [Aldersonia sp. NBC_00410]
MGVTTDVAAMEAAANHVETVNGQLDGLIRSLKSRCEGAAGNFWEGGASVQFQSLMTRYDDASKRLHQSLDTISQQIRANGKGYDSTEQANQDAIHSAGASGQLDIPTIL